MNKRWIPNLYKGGHKAPSDLQESVIIAKVNKISFGFCVTELYVDFFVSFS